MKKQRVINKPRRARALNLGEELHEMHSSIDADTLVDDSPPIDESELPRVVPFTQTKGFGYSGGNTIALGGVMEIVEMIREDGTQADFCFVRFVDEDEGMIDPRSFETISADLHSPIVE